MAGIGPESGESVDGIAAVHLVDGGAAGQSGVTTYQAGKLAMVG